MKEIRCVLALALALVAVLLPSRGVLAAPPVSASAQAFQTAMTADGTGILLDNFPLAHWSFVLDATTFQNLANDRDALRAFVAERVLGACLRGEGPARDAVQRDPNRCYAARRFLQRSYVIEERAGFVGAYRLATTFIAVSQDNWFSFDAAAAKTMDYLGGGDRSVHLYQGFDPRGVLVEGGVPLRELPVVLDHEERTVTIWTATLFD